MIIKENIKIGNKNFIKHYSDKNVMINKVGTDEMYSEAIDVEDSIYTYEETDKKIETEEEI